MSSDLHILLVVLFSAVGVGAAALIFYLRTRKKASHVQPAPNGRDSTTCHRDATILHDELQGSPLPESGLGDALANTIHESGEDAERSAAATEGHEDVAIVGGPPTRTEPGVRPDEEGGELSVVPNEEQVAASNQQPIPSDVAAISRGDSAPTEDLAKRQALLTEQPSKSRDEDEAPGSGDREDSEPEPTLHVPAGEENSIAFRAVRKDEDPGAFPQQGEVVEELDSSGDHDVRGETQLSALSEDTGEASADCAPRSAETVAGKETHSPPGEEASVEAAGPDETMGSGGVMAAAGATSTSDDRQVPESAAEDEGDEPDVNPTTVDQVKRNKRARKKKPRKYKGLSRAAPQLRDAAPQVGRPGGEEPTQRERSLPIEVRLRFDRGGFCSVALIAKRSAGLPEDLTAVARAGEVNLRAMQDEWYQDFVPVDFSSVLRNGTVWVHQGANGQCTWSLSGRELFVLADRPDISGYVSQPCLDLGRDHVVLGTEPLRSRVEEAIRKTGAQPTTIIDESFGAPPGWLVFRGVVPNEPVSPTDDADIFNALRPLPRIEISLERGIRLRYANWLDGHPPSIRVYGDPEHASEVRIDGQVAELHADGAYRAPGWDAVGSHTVWCAGTSRSYSLVPFTASWELWDAYAFPVAAGGTPRLAVCGPIVRAPASEPWGSESLSVPETNPVLLGPEPGQIVMAVKASPLRGAPRIASPSFRPIWALPRDPIRCDKKTTRILFVAGSEPPQPNEQQGSGPDSDTDADIARWCQLILNAGRKGMTTDPDTQSVRALWLAYKRVGRRIWRSLR